jgi:hypothetical protein
MGSTENELVRKAEAFLASAKSFKGDRIQRCDLMKQMDLLYMELEDPMDALMRQWSFVRRIFLSVKSISHFGILSQLNDALMKISQQDELSCIHRPNGEVGRL